MNTDTGEILPEAELSKRLRAMLPKDREAEEARWRKLEEFEAEMFQNPSMTPAERIAFDVRRKLAAQGGRSPSPATVAREE